MTDFRAEHRVLSHTLRLSAAPDAVFAMLTPEGERTWVDGWAPEVLHGDPERASAGDVFLTRHGDEETLWVVADLDAADRSARYVRISPGQRVAIVEVECRAAGEGDTEVQVRYTVTGLSARGNGWIRTFAEGFVSTIAAWKPAIEAAIAGNRG